MNTLTLSNLSIGYRGKSLTDNLNATLPEGQLTCLVGPNGVGKSTLLRTLCGFIRPIGGNVIIGGRDISKVSQKEMSQLVSVVLTQRPDVHQLTVRDIVGMGRAPYTDMWGNLRDEDVTIVNKSMEQVGVAHLASRFINTLSDGECQKVMIAKALAQDTPLIILDEPTAFLDYPSKVETMRLLKSLNRTILLSTHDLDMVIRLTDNIWFMQRDKQLRVGTPTELEKEMKEFMEG